MIPKDDSDITGFKGSLISHMYVNVSNEVVEITFGSCGCHSRLVTTLVCDFSNLSVRKSALFLQASSSIWIPD